MQPASPLRKWLLLGGVFILLPIIYFLISTGKSKYRELPILGPHEALANGDTLYHEIPPFSFTGIDGKPVTDKTLEGKIRDRRLLLHPMRHDLPAYERPHARVAASATDHR
ncbi:MAG: hypothetical protein IPI55_17615 [Flavobacteriales bacterium]|nr:hypothetical protein [Flavobacteriales bacterium]